MDSHTGVRLTSDIDEFVGRLRPGDVLLFDKLAGLSGLIQWADKAPVNHAAVYRGGGVLVEAGLNKPKAVAQQDLRVKLDDIDVRSVTALRHRDIAAEDQASQQRIVARMDEACQKPSVFAFEHLFKLAPYALARAYLDEMTRGRFSVSALTATLELLSMSIRRQRGPGELTCSEFVWRCLQESGFEVELPCVRTLRRRRKARQHRQLTRTGLIDAGTTLRSADAEPAAFTETEQVWSSPRRSTLFSDATDESKSFDPEPLEVLIQHTAETYPEEVLQEAATAPAAAGTWGFRRKSLAAHPSATGRGSRAIRKPVLADAVTPGDLWRSLSLTPVVVFHRPPNHREG